MSGAHSDACVRVRAHVALLFHVAIHVLWLFVPFVHVLHFNLTHFFLPRRVHFWHLRRQLQLCWCCALMSTSGFLFHTHLVGSSLLLEVNWFALHP